MYTVELVFEGDQEPTAYLCRNGVRIALLYDSVICIDEDYDDERSWLPGPEMQTLLSRLNH